MPRTRHVHRNSGQTMRHSHPGGGKPHGYYSHPEDHPAQALPDETYNGQPLAALWCFTCGNPVEGGSCGCWCGLAEALQRFLGMDFDHAADMAAKMWAATPDADKAFVWRNGYADDHDVPVYPPTPAGGRGTPQ